jgi:thymidylate synthase
MKQYLDLLQNILDNGVEKESGRANMPNTFGISHGVIQMDMNDGFPLLTTKKMFWKGIVHELLWFLRGETNIKYLVDNDVNVWNGDAYRWYLKHNAELNEGKDPMTMERFVYEIKTLPAYAYKWFKNSNYALGDLGKVYGYQWRNQNGVDQVKDVVDGLKENPYSRYHIIDGWNKADFREMALPPCHLLYQFIVRPLSVEERIRIYAEFEGQTYEEFSLNWNTDEEWAKDLDDAEIPKFYLDLNMYQRSCDTFLGVPFNIASMSLLLMLFAKISNMVPGVSTWIGGDTHLYMDHIPVAKEQLVRKPKNLPRLVVLKEIHSLEDILNLTIDDFDIRDYYPDTKLFGELFTGNKK